MKYKNVASEDLWSSVFNKWPLTYTVWPSSMKCNCYLKFYMTLDNISLWSLKSVFSFFLMAKHGDFCPLDFNYLPLYECYDELVIHWITVEWVCSCVKLLVVLKPEYPHIVFAADLFVYIDKSSQLEIHAIICECPQISLCSSVFISLKYLNACAMHIDTSGIPPEEMFDT